MATKKILTDLEVGGDIQVSATTNTNDLEVGTATGSVAGSIATIKSTSTSTGTSVNTWIDVNRTHSSTATGATYGGVVRVVSNSSSLDGGVVGINPVGRQSGSGGAEYIYGSLNTAEQTGSGDVDFIIASSAKAKSSGNGVATIDYVRGFSLTALQDNASSTVNYLQGAHMTAQLDAGSVGDVEVALLDFDQAGGAITGDLSYLRIQNDTISNISGTARAIWSLSTLPSKFAGLLESTSFVKTGGTSSQFLKADGSVDSTSYSTFDGAYSSLSGLPTLAPSNAEQNVQSNWNATSGDAFILNKPTIPTATSDLTNDSGFLSSVTGDWTGTFDGQEGSYYLNYNNLTNKPTIPTNNTQLTNGQGYISNYVVTSADVTAHEDDLTIAYSQLTGTPTLAPSNAEQNVQSDWNATSGDAFIKNKPSLFDGAYSSLSGLPTLFDGAYSSLSGLPTLAPSNAEQNVQSDWNATSGDALILNKPTLFDGAYSSLTGAPTIPNISGKLDNTTDTLTGTLTVTADVVANRLESSTSVQMGNDTDAASSSNVGSMRYRVTGTHSYADMCMNTDTNTYEWVNIVAIQFEQP
jgi:hypothetical protein